MATRYNWMADTQPEALEALCEIQRKMSPGEKLAMVLRTSEMMMSFAKGNVRKLYPDASEREVFLRAAARHLDRDTMIRVYGWDPEQAG